MLNVELNGTEPEHVGRITPKMSVDDQGNITWVPGLLDHNAKVFYRGKLVTNEEFNELFLQHVYRGNYLTDSLNLFFNKHLSNAINRKFRNDFKLVKSFVQPFTSEDWGEQQEDGYYYITIPASVHGFELDTENSDNALESVNIDIEMYLLNSEGLFYEVTQANIDSDNSVILYTDDITIPGFIVIRSNDKSYALVDVRINVDQVDNIADVAKTGKYTDLIDLDAADGPNTRINKNEKDIISILTGKNDAGDTVAVTYAINTVDAEYAKNVTDSIRNIPLENIFEDGGSSSVVKKATYANIARDYDEEGEIAGRIFYEANKLNTKITQLRTDLEAGSVAVKTAFTSAAFQEADAGDIKIYEPGVYQFFGTHGLNFGLVYWDGSTRAKSCVASDQISGDFYMLEVTDSDYNGSGTVIVYHTNYYEELIWQEEYPDFVLSYRKII